MKKILIVTLLVETSPQALPLGAACIASALKADFEIAKACSVKLLDFSSEDFKEESPSKTIAEAIIKEKPDYAGFSIFIWNHESLAEAATLVKKNMPDVTLFCGGPEVTANPENFKGLFDYVISGEGESQCVKLIRKLCGIKENSSEKNESAYCPALVSPYLDGTLDPEKYAGALWELARGCPFRCSYCFESKGEKKIVHFPEDRLKRELDLFRKKKIKQIWVLDPTYNADKKRAAAILDYIRHTAPDIFFHFEVRAEFLDKELIQKFAAVNSSLQIGIQSIHEDVLKNVNRTFNKKDFTKKISMLNNAGVIFGFDLIFGLPGDTLSKFCQSIDFALSLYPNHLELFKLSILPGTALYDDCTEQNGKEKKFDLTFMQKPPYHIIESSTYTKEDIKKASKLSAAASLFYTQGRAVSWFLSVLYPLKMRPSVFFRDFARWLDENYGGAESQYKKCLPHSQIEKLQVDFVSKVFSDKGLSSLVKAAKDLICLNGALTRAYAEGRTEILLLNYHPDELLSVWSQDLKQFTRYAHSRTYRVKTFPVKNGSDYRIM